LISASWYLLAVFSKIVAVNFLFVFIFTFAFFFLNNTSKFNKNFKIFFLSIIFILCIYFFALFNFSQLNNDINSISIIESFQNIELINIFKLLGYYFEKGFFPLYHDILFFELETYKVSIVKFLLFFLALYYSVHQYLKNRNEPTILFLSLFFLTLTTSYYSYFKSLDNTDFISITSVAERYVFMPSIFAVLFFGSLITKIKEKFKILSLTLLIFIFFIISFMCIDDYQNKRKI